MCQCETFKQSTTVRAGFRCVGRVYKHHFPTSIRRFVEQPLLEVSPARIQNTLTEMTVLHPVLDFQVFDGNDLEVLNKFVHPLIEEVFSLVLDVFVLALHIQQLFLALMASSFRPCQLPLLTS
jgi:hypothetical protein